MVVAVDIVRARYGRRLPVVLSVREVKMILQHMRRVPRLCATLMYGSGLRLTECVPLRVKDFDFDRGEIMVQCGKGDRDRRVPLPRLAVPGDENSVCRARLEVAIRFPAVRTYVERYSGKRRRHHLHHEVFHIALSPSVFSMCLLAMTSLPYQAGARKGRLRRSQ